MVDQLKFARPTTYLELLHQKKRREQRNLSGGDPEMDGLRPQDLDQPHDHTVSPFGGRRGGAAGDPADLLKDRHVQSFGDDQSSQAKEFVGFGSLCPRVRETWSKPSSAVWVCARQHRAPRPYSAPPQRPQPSNTLSAAGAAGAATTRPAVFSSGSSGNGETAAAACCASAASSSSLATGDVILMSITPF